jgi:EthD domain
MSEPRYKLLLFLKRRPGMSVEAFRDYYENNHRVLCEKYSVGVGRYVRRYLDPLPASSGELPFDVITELWFDSKAVFDKVVEFTSKGVLPEEVIADEERLFDRARSRVATVVECDSDMEAVTRKYG